MHIARKRKVESKNKCNKQCFFFNFLHFEPHIDILLMKYKEVDLQIANRPMTYMFSIGVTCTFC